jgi:hypothetical protein
VKQTGEVVIPRSMQLLAGKTAESDARGSKDKDETGRMKSQVFLFSASDLTICKSVRFFNSL